MFLGTINALFMWHFNYASCTIHKFSVQCIIHDVCNFYFCIIVNLSILAHRAIPVSTQSDVDPVRVPQRTIALST